MKISEIKFFVFALFMALASCKKDKMASKTNTPAEAANQETGLYVLNAGNVSLGSTSGTLTYYNFVSKATVPDQYNAANGTALGCSGNDIEIYGSKMYIVVTLLNAVDVVDAKTNKLIKQVSFVPNNWVNPAPLPMQGKEPRYIAFYKGNAFVSCNDGTVTVIDTATLAITKNIQVGANNFPQGLVVANGKLYIAAPGYEADITNTVFAVDLITLSVTKTITVIPDPENLVTDAYSNVYVTSAFTDDFNGGTLSTGGFTVINSQADTARSEIPTTTGVFEYNMTAIPIAVTGDFVYYLAGQNNKIAVFNAKTQTLVSSNFIADGTSLIYPTAIAANAATGEIYITDAKDLTSNGSLYAFDKTGKLEYTLTTGINPVKIVLAGN
jgi:hypothetical protein